MRFLYWISSLNIYVLIVLLCYPVPKVENTFWIGVEQFYIHKSRLDYCSILVCVSIHWRVFCWRAHILLIWSLFFNFCASTLVRRPHSRASSIFVCFEIRSGVCTGCFVSAQLNLLCEAWPKIVKNTLVTSEIARTVRNGAAISSGSHVAAGTQCSHAQWNQAVTTFLSALQPSSFVGVWSHL